MPELGDLRPYLIRVLDCLGQEVAGTGFLCHPDGYALTCWHVVAPWMSAGIISGEVISRDGPLTAQVVVERSVVSADLALLKLSGKPQDVRPGLGPRSHKKTWPYLPLDVHWRVGLDDKLRSFGYPKGPFAQSGIPITGEIGGLEPIAIEGVEALPIAGLNLGNVDEGYSGSPVLNQSTQKVIGLIHAKHLHTQAFMLPLAALFDAWTELRGEHDVFEQIRQRLGVEARAKLRNKLQAAPFIALSLERGNIPKQQSGTGTQGEEKPAEHGRTWQSFDIEQLVPPPPRDHVILSSDVGTGKTSFVYWLAHQLVEQSSTVPIVMACQEIERINPTRLDDLLEARMDSLKGEFLTVDLKAFCERAADANQLVFLFDGLDQIAHGKPSMLANQAFTLAERFPVLISSRPSAVLAMESDPTRGFLRLKPFSIQDQRNYFGERYPEAAKACALDPELTKIPMLAQMVRELLDVGELDQGRTRTELYGRFVSHIVTKHPPNTAVYADEPDLALPVLAQLKRLAFLALADTVPKVQKVPVQLYPEQSLVSLSQVTTFGLVNRILDRGEHVLFFTHQSFQEFLAAQYAANHPDAVDMILSERWHPKWTEVVRFLAGLCGQSILKRILEAPDNVIHANLFLAAYCANEVTRDDAQLIPKIKSCLYELAKNGPGMFRCVAIRALGGLGRWLDADIQCSLLQWTRGRDAPDFGPDPSVVREARTSLANTTVLSDMVISEIVRWLHSAEFHDREEGIVLLRMLSDRLEVDAVREILRLLRDADRRVRVHALQTLQLVGDRVDVEGVREIACRLTDTESRVRKVAVQTLGVLRQHMDSDAISGIVRRLGDSDAPTRQASVQTLAVLGDQLPAAAVREILRRLGDVNRGVREAARTALESLGKRIDVEAAREIAGWLRHPGYDMPAKDIQGSEGAKDSEANDSKTTQQTPAALSQVLGGVGGLLDRPAVQEMTSWLHDPDPVVRVGAIRALGSVGPSLAPDVVSEIVHRLHDGDEGVRESASEALACLGARLNPDAARLVAKWMCDRRNVLKGRSLEAITNRLHPSVMRELVSRLQDPSSFAREAAVSTLGLVRKKLGPREVREIAGRLRDEDLYVRMATIEVARSLPNRLDDALMHAVIERLDDSDVNVRENAARLLELFSARLDAAAQRAIVHLLRCSDARAPSEMTDPDEVQAERQVVFIVGTKLFQLGRDGERKERDIDYYLESRVRVAGMRVLEQIGVRLTAEALQEVAHRLQDPNAEVRKLALRTLKSVGSRLDTDAVSEIVRCLRDEMGEVRSAALGTLASLKGGLDLETLREIVDWLGDSNEVVRTAAIQALELFHDRLDVGVIRKIVHGLRDQQVARTLGLFRDRLDGKAIQEITQRLNHWDGQWRLPAIIAAGLIPDQLNGEAIGKLVRRLQTHSPEEQAAVLQALGALKHRQVHEACEAVMKLLNEVTDCPGCIDALNQWYRRGFPLPSRTR